MSEPLRLAGIELGGTKTLVLLAEGDRIIERKHLETRSPAETLGCANAELVRWNASKALDAIGIATFGPVQLRRDERDFGYMLPTPKKGWGGADIAGTLTQNLGCPWLIDTDVNGAALAEYRWGAGIGLGSLWYITIGTGLGGGLLVDGKPVHGSMHPEIGHIRVTRRSGDTFAGVCSFHGDCIEGLVSGPALARRFGIDAGSIEDDDPRWRDVAADLGELAATLLLTTAAQRILLGGSVATRRTFLLPMMREAALDSLRDYLPYFRRETASDLILLASLGDDAGPMGAIALAQAAADADHNIVHAARSS